MKNNNDIMREQIKFRMESDAWDLAIARRVLEIKNPAAEKSFNFFSMVSLATAAMAFIVFMSGMFAAFQNSSSYTGAGAIFSYAYIKNNYNLDNDTIAGGVELLINEAYPMR
jgi:hypothetical protein